MSRRETLTERITRTLADHIATGLYPQDQRLPSEQAMIEEFGVSRTVVREAIANPVSYTHLTLPTILLV